MFRFLIALLITSLFISSPGWSDAPFPKMPDPTLTPGSLCETPVSKRYNEGIAVCRRDVDPKTKEDIIKSYDSRLGYRVGFIKRALIKIDHLIPLCMGGSNRENNLWPQHESVYRWTDPVEGLSCEKLALGKLRQTQAIELIRKAKSNFHEIPAILAYLKSL